MSGIGDHVESIVRTVGHVFAEFVQQDSGCRSFGVSADDERWFLKAAVEEQALPSLERAVALHRHVRHPAIVPLRNVVRTGKTIVLVYPWVDGEVLYGAPVGGSATRLGPTQPHARFRALPVDEILAALYTTFDAHVEVARRGFVAVDLYDGCLIYDFDRRRMWLCDLDEYRPGPFAVEGDRLPGSRRFMAPEEFRRGATIDERTTVFNLGRTAQVLLDEGDMSDRWRASPELYAVAEKATRPAPEARYKTVDEFVREWRAAAGR